MKHKKSYFSIEKLKTYFPIETNFFGKPKKYLKALDGVSLKIQQGETLALVGESGSGKTTLGKTMLSLVKKTSGNVKWKEKNIDLFNKKEKLFFRKENQIIFQDPINSLNPSFSIFEILCEGLDIHFKLSFQEKKNKIKQALRTIGLEDAFDKYPHQFSGGQRQRIMIAKATLLQPKFIVCDEPVASLDVSIQAQILKLLMDLQKKYSLSYLFISHDLAVVYHIASRVVVMYLGEIVEEGLTQEIFKSPSHPYTHSLLEAIPKFSKRKKKLVKGDIPSPIDKPLGCVFNTRCDKATEKCFLEKPLFKKLSKTHFSACHFS